jgi:hypothetical protein
LHRSPPDADIAILPCLDLSGTGPNACTPKGLNKIPEVAGNPAHSVLPRYLLAQPFNERFPEVRPSDSKPYEPLDTGCCS